MNNLDFYKNIFNGVGWFIPPYVPMGVLDEIAGEIQNNGSSFSQKHLGSLLPRIYSAENLAAMVCERYPVTPYIMVYKDIISESIEAHFSGLGHISVSGLMPVIEGAGRKLADHWSVSHKNIKPVFKNLATGCMNHSNDNNIGAVGEIKSMMESFIEFTDANLYINSIQYPQGNYSPLLHNK